MTAAGYRGKHFITCEGWAIEEIEMALAIAGEMKRQHAIGQNQRLLQDKLIFMISSREFNQSRNAVAAGISHLGGHVHDLLMAERQLTTSNLIKDTAKSLSGLGDAIACRNCDYGIGHQVLNELSTWASVPVISLQDDIYHPLQALADLMTLKEFFGNNLKGLKVTIAWAYASDANKPISIPQSQLLLFARYGINVTVAFPEEFPLTRKIVHQAKNHAQFSGSKLNFVNDLKASFTEAQVVIPSNWGGYAGFKDYAPEIHQSPMKTNVEKYKNWICDQRILNYADPDVKIMHELPIDRGNEATDEVIDGLSSIIYDQAENQLHVAKAILSLTIGGK